MAETKYLHRRGGRHRSRQRYYVRVPIPADLQGRFGKLTVIERSLGTDSLEIAREVRWAIVAEIKAGFAKARVGILDPGTIEREARRHYETRLAEYGAKADDFFIDGDDTPSAADGGLLALQEAVADGAPDYAVGAVCDPILRRLGLQAGSAERQELCRAIYNAECAALQDATKVRNGEVPNHRAVLNPRAINPVSFEVAKPKAVEAQPDGLTVSEVGKLWIAEKTRVADPKRPNKLWAPSTVRMAERCVKLFAEHVSDASIRSITEREAAAFIERLKNLSKRYAREAKARTMTFDELCRTYTAKPGDALLAPHTLNQYSGTLFTFFSWAALKRNKHHGGPNPFADLSLEVSQDDSYWLPFTIAELNALIAGELYSTRAALIGPEHHSTNSALAWCFLISLYGGMRIEEAAGLRVIDVRRDDESEVDYFALEPHPGRRLKSKAARRHVPIHSQLIALGLLEYVESVRRQKHEYIFPALKPIGGKRGHAMTRRFSDYRERQCGIARDRVAFHSLRKNFASRLEAKAVPEFEAALLLGHQLGRGFTYTAYSPLGTPLKARAETVEKISYDGLKLPK